MDQPELPERLQWTLEWQSKNIVPLLRRSDWDETLLAYWRSQRRMAEVFETISLSHDAVSIDVGGGLTSPLRWLTGSRTCVDPLAAHYLRASDGSRNTGVAYIAGSGESLPLESRTCDFVVCTNCIDHTESPACVMREIYRVLKPSGWFLFTCEEHEWGTERNAGHPHALDRERIVSLTKSFDQVLRWEVPWLPIIRHFRGEPAVTTTELGFLLRKN